MGHEGAGSSERHLQKALGKAANFACLHRSRVRDSRPAPSLSPTSHNARASSDSKAIVSATRASCRRAWPLEGRREACIKAKPLRKRSVSQRGVRCSCVAGRASKPTRTEVSSMTERAQPTDLELAALISSKICHDVIGPVGAIYNGLEILDEDDDAQAKTYALDVIRNVTQQASARLQFARFAFGAAGSSGAQIELGTAEQISRGLVGQGKHKLVWRGIPGHMAKDKVKLLLNMIASAITSLPRGGEIEVTIADSLERPTFRLRCRGAAARPPQLDALSIQAYYTWRLAASTRMRLDIVREGADVLLGARPMA